MSDQLDLDLEEQQNRRAATVLAHLIYSGFASVPPESLPDDWRSAYEAVRAVSESYMVPRRQAFETAIVDSPFHLHMQMEVEEALEGIDHPQDQLRVYSAWETLRQPAARSWVVENVLTPSSLNFLVGAPGSKKTWTILDLAVSVATGQPWLGHETSFSIVGAHGNAPSDAHQPSDRSLDDRGNWAHGRAPQQSEPAPSPRGVLILDEEGGLQRMWDRLSRTLRGHHAAPDTPVYFIPNAGFKLDRPGEIDSIAARARYHNVRLIIIDALSNLIPATDENNVLSMQPVLEGLRKLAKETGAAVLVVHHTNKQGIFRGSSLMAAEVDHMLALESDPQDDLIRIATVKARDIPPVALTAHACFETNSTDEPTFRLELDQPNGSPPSRPLSQTSSNILQLLDASTLTYKQISDGLSDLSPGTVRNVLHQLVVTGRVQRADSGSRGRKALYCLPCQAPTPSHHDNN